MNRPSLVKKLILLVASAAWVFFLFALASFHTDDWPSHQVYPHPPIQNLCGATGAFLAYHLFFLIGQGVFPILLFTGICLVLILLRNRISDLWLRGIGLALIAIAFASLIHLIKPGSPNSFPEGYGGIAGIGASAFLKAHFGPAGSGLILLLSLLVGLVLTADELFSRAPMLLGHTLLAIRQRAPAIQNRVPHWPKMPKPAFLTGLFSRQSSAGKSAAATVSSVSTIDEDTTPSKPAAILRQNRIDIGERIPLDKTVNGQQIEFNYDNDDPAPAATEAAYADDAAAPPSEPAVIPPPEQQAVELPPKPQAVINSRVAPTNISSFGVASVATGLLIPPETSADSIDAPKADSADANAAVVTNDLVPGEPPNTTITAENPTFALTDAVASHPEIIVRTASAQRPLFSPPPPPQPKELGEYQLPPWDHLCESERGFAEEQERYVREKAAALEQALREFNIDAHVVEIDTGPVITMYEISIAAGIKVSAITALQNDIARALSAVSVRIVAPVPGKNTVGIEVPNPKKEKVRLKELMALAPEATHKMVIPLFLGKDASGEPLVADLAAMPHCLIAGTTGSGKSVCINSIIMSILYTQRPDMVKMILVDPKVVELQLFESIPHLMCQVINDAARATSVLEWACQKMDERYEFLAEAGVRNIAAYNKLTRDELVERFKPSSPEEEAKIPKFLPYIIIIIDELADLMMTSGKEVEAFIVRVAQKARAVGIHLILATQRPQANVVTGLIKANMPSKIAFRVNTRMDSRIVLDQNGADLLLGQGDMLFLPPGMGKPIRSQGTYIDDKEIRDTVRLTKAQAEAQYEPELMQIRTQITAEDMDKDELFDDAVKIILETKRGSVSLLQRRLTIGYGRASRLIEMMAAAGIVGAYKGSQAREAMLTLEEWEALKASRQRDKDDGMTV